MRGNRDACKCMEGLRRKRRGMSERKMVIG